MSQEHTVESSRYRRVRRRFWWLMAAAVLLAFSVPVVGLWHAEASPLLARVCLWPRIPQVGQTTWLIVTLPNETDQAATDGPWAQARVAWDMPAMAMGTSAVAVPGSPQRAGVFAIPLALAMAGSWWARVELATPGRPMWQMQLRFIVHPQQAPALDASPPPALRASSACAITQVAGPQPEGS